MSRRGDAARRPVARARGAFGAAVLWIAAGADPGAAQRADSPWGPLDFVGLEFSLPEAVVDSLVARVPDGSPAGLTEALLAQGFARARVDRVAASPGAAGPAASDVLLVTVVERSRAGMLELRSPRGALGDWPPRWETAAIFFRDENPAFLGAVTLRGLGGVESGGPRTLALGTTDELEQARVALELLDVLVSGYDRGAALRILAEDGDPEKRAFAAAVLSGFPGDERAWHGLAEALLDPSAIVNSFASQALGSLVAAAPMPVDWSSPVEVLHSLLAGANLSAFPLVVQVLASTGVSPELAAPLLANNAHLVLGHLAAEASPHRETVHRFLVQIRGEDPGLDVAAWRSWIDGL